MLRSSQTCVKISSVRKSYPENGFMWLGHDGIAVGLTQYHKQRRILSTKIGYSQLAPRYGGRRYITRDDANYSKKI
jgi:hypothetical protein